MLVGVTGGRGFIGKWVVEEALRCGHKVMVLDHVEREESRRTDVDYLWGDVRDETDMMELAAHCDGIIHLAAVLGTQETIDDPRPSATTNIQGGLNFLHAINRYDLPGVYICVGNHWMENPYSISKTTIERFCNMYRIEHGTRINQVRAVNAYGPLQAAAPPFGANKVRKITPSFVCRAISGMDIEVYGDGSQISDMVWVGDLAYTLVKALEDAHEGIVHDRIIECGPETHNTVLEVAQMVAEEVSMVLNKDPVNIVHLPMRPGEKEGDVVTANTETLAQAGIDTTGFKELRGGIADTVAWFIENEGVTWNA